MIFTKFISVCKKRGLDCVFIDSLDGMAKDSFIIPQGSTSALEMIKQGYKTNIVLQIDAYTLGELNKIWFYLSHGYIFCYDFPYSIYAVLAFFREEWKVVRTYHHVVMVSNEDIRFFKKVTKSKSSFLCVPNGVEVPSVSPKTKSNVIRLGLLNSWGHRVSYDENKWFVEDYFRKYVKTHPNVELHIAGRGRFGDHFAGLKNIKYVGEVDSLDDFFKNIDVFISACPKGCGILNRVLDAFSYKTIVLGHEKSFSGFREMKDSYLEFHNYKSFEKKLDFIIENPDVIKTIVNNAYNEISIRYNWDKNYNKLIDYIEGIV